MSTKQYNNANTRSNKYQIVESKNLVLPRQDPCITSQFKDFILINENVKIRLYIPVNIYSLTIIYNKLIKMYKAHYYRNKKKNQRTITYIYLNIIKS